MSHLQVLYELLGLLVVGASDADKVISSKAKARYCKVKATAIDHKVRAKDMD